MPGRCWRAPPGTIQMKEPSPDILAGATRYASGQASMMGKLLKIQDRNTGRLIPFNPNYDQWRLNKSIGILVEMHRPVRMLVLKSRKIGVSTDISALYFTDCHSRPQWSAETVAHTADSTREIFAMVKRMQENLPD